MTRRLLYVAHPVAPSEEEFAAAKNCEDLVGGPAHGPAAAREWNAAVARAALAFNLKRGMRWLNWFRVSFPETTFIAQWIASIMAGCDDSDPKQREAGLVDCCAVVERCDGIVLCGGRISSGMRREMEHGRALDLATFRHREFEVYDLTSLASANGGLPPSAAEPRSMSFYSWACQFAVRGDSRP